MIGGSPIAGSPIAALNAGIVSAPTPADDILLPAYGEVEEPESSLLDWVESIPTAVIAAVSAGIIALTLGYAEPAPAEELDSFTSQIYVAQAALPTNEAEVGFVLGEGIEPDAIDESVYEPLPLAEFVTPAAADQTAALGIEFPDGDDPEPIEDSFIGGTFEDAPAVDPGAILQLVTDLAEDDPTEESVTPYFFDDVTPPLLVEFPPADDDEPLADAVIAYLIEDAEAADLTQIPPPVLTDPEGEDDLQDAAIAFLFEDAPEPPEEPAVLVLDFPDELEPEQDIEAALAFVFENPAAPDLTFVPGWQDDFLRAYEDEREEQDKAALLGMVFDPYGQVDDPPPVVPGEGVYIPPFRRRRR